MEYLTAEQIDEWEAYDRIDPIGSWRDDFRMAMMCSLITNIARAVHSKKGVEMTTPEDFMPDWTGEEKGMKKQSVEDMKQVFLSIASSVNQKTRPRKKMQKK